MQGEAVKNGNTLILDPKDFSTPYADKWGVLSSIKRINEDTLNALIEEWDLKKASPIKSQTINSEGWVAEALKGTSESGRDKLGTKLAGYYINHLSKEDVLTLLLNWDTRNIPPLGEKDIRKIVDSVARYEPQKLTERMRQWVLEEPGEFTNQDVYRDLGLKTPNEQAQARNALKRFKEEGTIEYSGKRKGHWKTINREVEIMNFIDAPTETLDLRLPFGIHKMVETYPGNILVLAGFQNAGKTAFLLNTVYGNMRKFDVHYFNSEMGDTELRKRLDMFTDIALSDWTFTPYERSDDFADVIRPGKGKLNIIDYLEMHTNFFEISGRLAEIHKRLDGAVAIVAIQKNPGSDMGLGGYRGGEKIPLPSKAKDMGTL